MHTNNAHIATLHLTRSRRRTTTVRSNDTLVDTPFQLISGFFHVNKVLSVLSKLPPGVCWRGGGGGGGGATGLLKKGGGSIPGLQKAVEFPQVQTSTNNYCVDLATQLINTQTFSLCLFSKVY